MKEKQFDGREILEIFATEKLLNKRMGMVLKPKTKPIEYPIILSSPKDNVLCSCDSGYFNRHHWKILDLITTSIIHCAYVGKKSKTCETNDCKEFKLYVDAPTTYIKRNFLNLNYVTIDYNTPMPNKKGSISTIKNNIFHAYNKEEIIELIDKSDGYVDEEYIKEKKLPLPVKFKFNIKELKNSSNILKSYSTKKIENIIREIKEFKIILDYEYCFYLKIKQPFQEKIISRSTKDIKAYYSSLFKIENIDNDGNVILNFNTTLGYFYMNNILACNVIYTTEKFYNSKISHLADFFYRSKLINCYKKNEEMQFRLDYLALDLGIINTTYTKKIKAIVQICKELKNSELIYNFKFSEVGKYQLVTIQKDKPIKNKSNEPNSNIISDQKIFYFNDDKKKNQINSQSEVLFSFNNIDFY